jgi:hypothetical protein
MPTCSSSRVVPIDELPIRLNTPGMRLEPEPPQAGKPVLPGRYPIAGVCLDLNRVFCPEIIGGQCPPFVSP